MIEFEVIGLPAAQGSKTPWGSEANPRVMPWRQDIAARAAETWGDQPPHTGPVELQAIFYFPRPKSHYGTGRNEQVLRKDAPFVVTKKPDLDKLMRALGDALTGIVFRDDSQLCKLMLTKQYHHRPGVRVWIQCRDR